MSCLQIDMLINNKITTIDTDAMGVDNLCINKQIIAIPDRVYRVSITSKLIIVLAESAAFRNGAETASKETVSKHSNTINAYDWNGKLLWNITDIVGDIDSYMVGGHLCTDDVFQEWNCDKRVKGHDLYACYDWDGRRYLIDLLDRSVLQIAITK